MTLKLRSDTVRRALSRGNAVFQYIVSTALFTYRTRMVWLPAGEKFHHTFGHFDRIPACDRRTDISTA